MSKSPDAFRTISEVAEWLGIQAHVLRFWESKFTQVKPVKRAGGRRYYRPADMLLLGGIKRLLHDDGLTIKGVQKILREQGVGHVSELSQGLDETAAPELIQVADDTVVQLHARAAPEDATDGQMGMDLPAPDAAVEAKDQELPSFLRKPARIKTELPSEPTAEPKQASLEIDPVVEPTSEPAPSEDAVAAESATPAIEEAVEAVAVAEPAPQPKPLSVEVADVPADDAIEADPGLLSKLVALETLTPQQAGELKPLAGELRAWIERQEAISAG
ncbi:MerR family transcriptional regulator [Tropicibacter sp. R16_0]|uniref:MerR family transcriptional regulator n=1 Tax=Tropicibacter sp. R16_0 TaxID=2821102 RepID=UPI001ADA20C5|nr:MerR family transcriptional regulator [Tropicibacter sp. R16_0]MBO9453185.1 MerR family transcriptional regulator [Tropicibacter sp. R16_0]